MTITICGSITFYDEMEDLEKDLLKLGFTEVLRPIGVGGKEKEFKEKLNLVEDAKRKIKLDLINEHWKKILRSDCILIANYEKRGVPGYVGGNTLIEMGYGFVLGKPIFMMNPVPKMQYSPEIEGMQPIILDQKLSKIIDYYKLG